MKINRNANNHKGQKFGTLAPGTVFRNKSRSFQLSCIFMKCVYDHGYWAVDVEDGVMVNFSANTEVVPLNAELNVSEE